jgi:hypothetical protein
LRLQISNFTKAIFTKQTKIFLASRHKKLHTCVCSFFVPSGYPLQCRRSLRETAARPLLSLSQRTYGALAAVRPCAKRENGRRLAQIH